MNSVAMTQMTLQLIIKIPLAHFLGALNFLQIIAFQTMMNFSFPGNAKIFTFLLLQIINAEVLDPEWTTELIYDFTRDRDIMD